MEKRLWEADFNRLADALLPYTETIDGVMYISNDAPAELSGMYVRIVQMGYANGFMP